ncbi:hypothetical protein JR316_0001192 [Psilocybe cubensis]|uniref:Uncharacterized protein n=2 Tax=Psilocybe cubensis TaxID=181762 RepID=A0A8H8CR23_PSICU|nr:hypothetical protein JR316_0001192 [Psilocybe cubensis]KAH9487124.1 hypothetical protein JR316_0001192 [Psilocybe cubensis]
MSWNTFECQNPDLCVKSAVDGTIYPASRAALMTSDVFKDMFACCDVGPSDPKGEDALELQETGGELAALLRLLHDPPPPPEQIPTDDLFQKIRYNLATVIPLPLLVSLLFRLVDKYAIAEAVAANLRVHLRANAPAYPLEVYGFATLHEMDWEASEASQFVRPMASYRLDDIAVLPSVISYHKLVKLQHFRVKALQDLLLAEEIFPHGYGACTTHNESTTTSWDRQRKALMGRIDSATDVAGEMSALTETFVACKSCYKACTAAVEMLAYKCKRLPRRLDQVSNLW